MVVIESVLYRVVAIATDRNDDKHAANEQPGLQIYTHDVVTDQPKSGLNSEQSFAAGYALSFLKALKHCAQVREIALPSKSAVTVHLGIGHQRNRAGLGFEVEIGVTFSQLDKVMAQTLIECAHHHCNYATSENHAHILPPVLMEPHS